MTFKIVTIDHNLLQAGVQNFGGQFVTLSEINENARRLSLLIEEHRPAAGDVRESQEAGSIYHALTYGLLVDQLVRRVDAKHRSLAQYFTEEIAQPLQLGIYPAIAPELFYRFGPLTCLSGNGCAMIIY